MLRIIWNFFIWNGFSLSFCSVPSTCNIWHLTRERNKLRKFRLTSNAQSHSRIHSLTHRVTFSLFALMASSFLVSDTQPWKDLKVTEQNWIDKLLLLLFLTVDRKLSLNWSRFNFEQAHVEDIKKTHLRDLLTDDNRCRSMLL